ncbi:MAG: UDP-3-O-acylglucosamine N-acyltransferase [Phycisphaerae bacterium]|nr:UDP-3-O-acylglucosamine N-acyltransferase [Phycisphaerae bacterium]
MKLPVTAEELARVAGATVRGDGAVLLRGVAAVAEAGPDELTFITQSRYAGQLSESRAGAVLVPRNFGPAPMTALLCDRVDAALAAVLGALKPEAWSPPVGAHELSWLDPQAVLEAGVRVGPFVTVAPGSRVGSGSILHPGVFVGRDVRIGRDCVLGPSAVVHDGCVLGDRVVLKAGAVIGGDGFGFYFDGKAHRRVPHAGNVVLEDDVEIGSGTCVDRAKFGSTHIAAGTKIDNHVQVGHNCRIGRATVIAAQTGLSGSTRIGDFCVLAGRSGSVDGATIASKSTVAAVSVVVDQTTEGQVVMGYPAKDAALERRIIAAQRRLPDLLAEVRDLRKRLERLEASAHDQPGSRD